MAVLRKDRKKQRRLKSLEDFAKSIKAAKQDIADANVMLADNAAMLAEVTAKYQTKKTDAQNVIAGVKTNYSKLKTRVESDADYGAIEKTEYLDAWNLEINI